MCVLSPRIFRFDENLEYIKPPITIEATLDTRSSKSLYENTFMLEEVYILYYEKYWKYDFVTICYELS